MSGFLRHLSWRLEVLAYDIVRILIRPFSIDTISNFGGFLFKKIGPKTSKQKIIRKNMDIVFPDMNEREKQELIQKAWENMGRTFAEFPLLHRMEVYSDNSRVEVEGLEILTKLADAGKGAVLISGHFANWEIMAAVFSQAGLPVQVTYRPTNNPYFDKRIRREREKYGIKLMVPKSGAKGAKQLVSALKGGEMVALLNDQKFNQGIEIDFFGQSAMTAPGPTRMALQTDTPLIPMSIERKNGVYFKVKIHPPIKLENTGNKAKDTNDGVRKITDFIEKQILKSPQDWFWVHRRWPKDIYKTPK